ncbi:MAG: sialate O-acetylesterase [Lachnospiraceae bacterium]|nr:sialate O-acetylesterase [Lachnospiraceae bacterium]
MRLPYLLTEKMILRQNAANRIWGYSNPDTSVSVSLLGDKELSKAEGKTDAKGFFLVELNAPSFGGPYTLEIKCGDDVATVKDVCVGEIFLLGGQSNMEIPLARVREKYKEDIDKMATDRIRIFLVPKKYYFSKPQEELGFYEAGSMKDNVQDFAHWNYLEQPYMESFSALGTFMADELLRTTNIPIGLVQIAVGGTPAEAWISEETLRDMKIYDQEIEDTANPEFVNGTKNSEAEAGNAWWKELNDNDPGFIEDYPNLEDASSWTSFEFPFNGDKQGFRGVFGSVWLRKEVMLDEKYFPIKNEKCLLRLGTMIDSDITYLNGKSVGTTGYQYPPRAYSFDSSLLHPGKNVITIRLCTTYCSPMTTPDKPYYIGIDGARIDLKGEWKFMAGKAMPPAPPATFFEYKARGTYNAMLCPVSKVNYSGIAFYQGESNDGNPKSYEKVFRAVIADWRKLLGEKPFVFVQLANFGMNLSNKDFCGWAEIREAQRKCLDIKDTGMVVATDVGEFNDLHPMNKRDLGWRAAAFMNKLCGLNAVGLNVTARQNFKVNVQEVEAPYEDNCKYEIFFTDENNKRVNVFYHEFKMTPSTNRTLTENVFVRHESHPVGEFVIFECDKSRYASAELKDGKLYVSYIKNAELTGIAYGYSDSPQLCLYTDESVPIPPFIYEMKK